MRCPGITRCLRPSLSYSRSPSATTNRPRAPGDALNPAKRSTLPTSPPNRLDSGTTVSSGRTRWAALRSSRLRSRVASATSENAPLSR
ncbi:hypothetical protein D3C72_1564850 [compost metagenome]